MARNHPHNNVEGKKMRIEIDPYRLYMKEVNTIPLLTREQEIELAHRSQKGDKEALKKLVEANLRFVVATARKYRQPDVPLLDLINEGNIGLIEAARRFDPTKNVRFLSYAVWWIKQAIHHYLNYQGKMIPLGTKITSILSKLKKLRIENEDGDVVNRENISNEIGISIKELDQALQLSNKVVSLEIPLDEEGGQVFGETISQEVLPSPEQVLIAKERDQYVKALMSHLTDIEAEILKMRFGIDGNNRMTLREIGDIFGLTRERIRQLESQSLRKLQPIVRKEHIYNIFCKYC